MPSTSRAHHDLIGLLLEKAYELKKEGQVELAGVFSKLAQGLVSGGVA